MGWILATFHRAVAAAERIEEVFETPPEPAGGARPDLRGQVSVQDLTFRYPGQDHPALAGVSFALEPGAKLGLVGPVGSGKSTLLALLLRLYDPPPGSVRVDGHDVLDLDPAVLRATFALAPQDPFLFSDTIAGNVRFGVGAAEAGSGDGLEVHAAVEVSALDRDLEQIQGGLEAVVGERGITLSGGQKQRVSLARALAANRAALVLDDTLSAVDYSTETTILERLRRARRGRTMIVASHRLTAVEDSDLILVLDQGSVVERGTHAELVRRGGWYADMWRRQQEHQALEGGGEP
jgi:ABC-type multidrug transport system fused ATPase/permease subunit